MTENQCGIPTQPPDYSTVVQRSINEHMDLLNKHLWDCPPDNRTPEQKAEDEAIQSAWLKEYNRWPNRLRRFRSWLWIKVTRPLHWFGPCYCEHDECEHDEWD